MPNFASRAWSGTKAVGFRGKKLLQSLVRPRPELGAYRPPVDARVLHHQVITLPQQGTKAFSSRRTCALA